MSKFKRAVVSDLHLDFGDMPENFFEWRGDALFLAGDIGEEDRLRSKAMRPFWDQIVEMAPRVYMVCGNHEFYGSELDTTIPHLKEFFFDNYPSVQLLENETAELDDGSLLVAGTLWTNFNDSPLYAFEVGQALNDYRCIRRANSNYRRINTNDIKQLNQRTLHTIETVAGSNLDRQIVVMTHHAPSFASIHPKFATPENFAMNTGYANNLDRWIESCDNIQTWLHGHIHAPNEYTTGKTHVVSNPRGYPRESVHWYTRDYVPFEF